MRVKLIGGMLPKRATGGSSGFDLYVQEDTWVEPGRNVVPTGICIGLEIGQEGQVRPRSGYSLKGMLCDVETYKGSGKLMRFRANADVLLGTIDSDYRGEVGVIIHNHEPFHILLKEGQRIAQLVIQNVSTEGIDVVDDLDDTDRGSGGFGHSGS